MQPLKGKLEKIESINDILSSQDNTLKNEALSALVVLGIERKKANKAIDEFFSNKPNIIKTLPFSSYISYVIK